MLSLNSMEVWFVTGSQHLYGPEALQQVAADSQIIASGLDTAEGIPCRVVFKPVVTTPEAITQVCMEADAAANCIGLIAWMHTFSPAKMWIAGLSALRKPFVHLHTQFGRDIPWERIDMDFMNLHQSAHGGREFGFICSRLRKARKVVVGHWEDPDVRRRIDIWMRAAAARHDLQGLKIARFGDNMREVAVTEGDKVEAQKIFGFSVNGYGVGDLVDRINAASEPEVDAVVASYHEAYEISVPIERQDAIRDAARIEAGLRAFLEEGDFRAFTTTFEDLHGLRQLPGLAVQRMMGEGYGFGAEGDWKTAALVRAMKVMSAGLPGGTSFMEDYTYHLDPKGMQVLGAHMLEVCASIAAGKPKIEVHPLGIGGKADPVRVVFTAPPGKGLNASLIDMGNRFRLIVNPLDVVAPEHDLPRLPVARVLWVPEPNLKVGAEAWILAGGAHHSGFSMALEPEHLEDFADMTGMECLLIDRDTQIRALKQELRTNEVYYAIARGF